MQRRSLFSFDLMSDRSEKGTREIEIPLLGGKGWAAGGQQHQRQAGCLNDRANSGRRPLPTAFERGCGWLQRRAGVVDPESPLLLLWNILNLLAIFYNFLQIPVVILVASADPEDAYTRRLSDRIDLFCLSVLLLDLLLVRFRVGGVREGRAVRALGAVAGEYARVGLWVDALCFLVYYLHFLLQGEAIYVKLLFYLKYFTFRQVDQQVADRLMYSQYWNALYRFLRMVAFIFFLTSLEACLYFAIDYYYYTQQGTNYQLGFLWLTSSQATFPLDLIQAFNWPAWYDFALYWAVQTTSAVGYGNMTPRNPAEVLLCNVVMLTTICIFVAFADTILDIVDELQENTLRRQGKFTEINTFTANNRVQPDTRKKVAFYFDCLIESKYDDSEDALSALLSARLQQDFALAFRPFLSRSLPLLRALTAHPRPNAFARALTRMARVAYFSTGDYVERLGRTSGFRLYVIQRGKVTLFNETVDYRKDCRVLDCFGQQEFFFGGMGLANVVARTFNKFYYFEQAEFFAALRTHPQLYQRLRQAVDEVRHNRGLAGEFQLSCYNCDEEHLLESCPVATLWRNRLPRQPPAPASHPHPRVPHARRALRPARRLGGREGGGVGEGVRGWAHYFSFMNL